MAGIDNAARQHVAGPPAVFFVGDSITLGWRDESFGGWPARLAAGLLPTGQSVTMYNLGVRGDTSEEIADRWNDEVVRRRRDPGTAIVFAFGVNDAKLDHSGALALGAARTRVNVRQILSRAVTDHRVLFVGPTPVDEAELHHKLNPTGALAMPSNQSIAEIRRVIAVEAARLGVPFLDLFDTLSSEPAWFDALRETDGLHPPASGHDIIAGIVGAWQPWTELFAAVRL